MNVLFEIFGWVGTTLIIIAFYLNSTQKITSTSSTYQLLNLIGALGVGVNVLYNRAWPALALQIIWGLIALISLIRINK